MLKLIRLPRLILPLVCAVSAGGCSGGSPVNPVSPAASTGLDARRSADAPGVYGLSFNITTGGALQEVTTLAVSSQELILKARVTDTAGNLATRGTVTFDYCSYAGRPNDISDADEAPAAACAQGLAQWARLGSRAVEAGTCPGLGTGYACLNFGIVRIPRTVGFRIRYSPKGGGISSGASPARDFTWTALGA